MNNIMNVLNVIHLAKHVQVTNFVKHVYLDIYSRMDYAI